MNRQVYRPIGVSVDTSVDTPPIYRRILNRVPTEILVRSLANFYRQYADRHMNLKFMQRVSEREWAFRPFVVVKNKLMSVFNESVLLLTMNFVITLSK